MNALNQNENEVVILTNKKIKKQEMAKRHRQKQLQFNKLIRKVNKAYLYN
jgi:hypothetical protein